MSSHKVSQRRLNVFNFMERPKTKKSMVYHVLVYLLIIVSIVFSVLTTVDDLEKDKTLQIVLTVYESLLLFLFFAEYVARVFTCDVIVKYKGTKGRLKFMISIYMLVDILIIISTLTSIVMRGYLRSYLIVLRFTRFFQILRILRLDRQRGDLRTMWRVVSEHKKELITCYFLCFIILFLGAYAIYMVEKTQDHLDGGIDNMVNGIYWGIITFTSVGYGDYSPQTWPGKILTMLFSIVGCAIFSLPAGIIGSGFALQVSKQKKEKRFFKTRHPAAMLIQAAWRRYALSCKHLNATWFYVLPTNTDMLNNRLDQSFTKLSQSDDNIDERKPFPLVIFKKLSKLRRFSLSLEAFDKRQSMASAEDLANELEPTIISRRVCTRGRYRIAVQFIITVKLYMAISSFKSTCLPYVNVDEIVQRSSNNIAESLSQLKDINERLDLIVKELKSLKKDVDEIKGFKRPLNATDVHP